MDKSMLITKPPKTVKVSPEWEARYAAQRNEQRSTWDVLMSRCSSLIKKLPPSEQRRLSREIRNG